MKKQIDISINIDFGDFIRLDKIESHSDVLRCAGIYFLLEGRKQPTEKDPLDSMVVYIGKAIRETILSRNQKHYMSVADTRTEAGVPKTRPGKAFRQYREKIDYNPKILWVWPGRISKERPYQISCAEEYFLFEYRKTHGRSPNANTA